MDCKTDCMKMIDLGKKKMSKQQKIWNQFHLITILIQNQAVHHCHHFCKWLVDFTLTIIMGITLQK